MLYSLTYNCTEEQQTSLRETNAELSKLMSKFKASPPHKEGLLICPEARKHLKQSQKNEMCCYDCVTTPCKKNEEEKSRRNV